MLYVREHTLAQSHPVTIAGQRRADAAVRAGIRYDRALAQRKRERAQKLLDEASELEYQAGQATYGHEYKTRFKAIREEIEDRAYWEARAEIGTLPRDESGEYTTPAPLWTVSYMGEHIGVHRGEERCDVLRIVCPRGDERSWSDFELNIVEENET